MANHAQFTTATIAPTSSLRGYAALPGATVALALPVQAIAVSSVVYTVTNRTAGAPAVTLAGATTETGASGISVSPTTPTAAVNLTLPSTYLGHVCAVRCRVNGGMRLGADGVTLVEDPDLNFTRAIGCLFPGGGRRIMPGEVGEWDPVFGWTGALSLAAAAAHGEPDAYAVIATTDATATNALVLGDAGDLPLVDGALTMLSMQVFSFGTAGGYVQSVERVIRRSGSTVTVSSTGGTTVQTSDLGIAPGGLSLVTGTGTATIQVTGIAATNLTHRVEAHVRAVSA